MRLGDRRRRAVARDGAVARSSSTTARPSRRRAARRRRAHAAARRTSGSRRSASSRGSTLEVDDVAARAGARLALRGRRRQRPRAADAHGQVPGAARAPTRSSAKHGAAALGRRRVAARDLHRPAGRRGRAHARGRAGGGAARARRRRRDERQRRRLVRRPRRARDSRLVVDEDRRVIVGATITGAEVAESLHAATIAVVARCRSTICGTRCRRSRPAGALAAAARGLRALTVRLARVRTVAATRYVTPLREGGSLPALVEADDDGLYVLKFRGAGQGPKALVAEVIVGELARALGFPVPELVLVELDADDRPRGAGPRDPGPALASDGLNLGVDFLPGSLPFSPPAGPAPDRRLRRRRRWLDALVTNVDRTAAEPQPPLVARAALADRPRRGALLPPFRRAYPPTTRMGGSRPCATTCCCRTRRP